MATLAQLQSEPWWGREITTSPMVGLGLQLRGAYGTGALSVGIKGNERHLSGGHRSQEWIGSSAYCTNHTYTVQSGLSGDQLRYCAALDFTPGVWGSADNRAKMRVLTARMITAMKAGRCDEVLEVFGTLDGSTVTGWRNDLNASVTSDSSHLDHLHVRFDRRYCNDNAVMSKVAAILLEDEMPLTDADIPVIRRAIMGYQDQGSRSFHDQFFGDLVPSAKAAADGVTALNAKVAAISAVDPAAVAAALAASPDFVAALAAAVVEGVADREAAADRARADVLDG